MRVLFAYCLCFMGVVLFFLSTLMILRARKFIRDSVMVQGKVVGYQSNPLSTTMRPIVTFEADGERVTLPVQSMPDRGPRPAVGENVCLRYVKRRSMVGLSTWDIRIVPWNGANPKRNPGIARLLAGLGIGLVLAAVLLFR